MSSIPPFAPEGKSPAARPLREFVYPGLRNEERARQSRGLREFQRLLKRIYRAEHAAQDFLENHSPLCRCGFCYHLSVAGVRTTNQHLSEVLFSIAAFARDCRTATGELYGSLPASPQLAPEYDDLLDFPRTQSPREGEPEIGDEDDTTLDDDAMHCGEGI